MSDLGRIAQKLRTKSSSLLSSVHGRTHGRSVGQLVGGGEGAAVASHLLTSLVRLGVNRGELKHKIISF